MFSNPLKPAVLVSLALVCSYSMIVLLQQEAMVIGLEMGPVEECCHFFERAVVVVLRQIPLQMPSLPHGEGSFVKLALVVIHALDWACRAHSHSLD